MTDRCPLAPVNAGGMRKTNEAVKERLKLLQFLQEQNRAWFAPCLTEMRGRQPQPQGRKGVTWHCKPCRAGHRKAEHAGKLGAELSALLHGAFAGLPLQPGVGK